MTTQPVSEYSPFDEEDVARILATTTHDGPGFDPNDPAQIPVSTFVSFPTEDVEETV